MTPTGTPPGRFPKLGFPRLAVLVAAVALAALTRFGSGPAPAEAQSAFTPTVRAGPESLFVSWRLERFAGSHTVQWKSGSEQYQNSRSASVSGTTLSYRITGLTPGTTYTVRVQVNRPGRSNLTGEATGIPTLGKVTGVTVTAAPESLKVSWTATAMATSYSVRWKGLGWQYNASRTMSGLTTTSYTITGLTGNTMYMVVVRAHAHGTPDGPNSDEKTGTPTISLPAVSGLTVKPSGRVHNPAGRELDHHGRRNRLRRRLEGIQQEYEFLVERRNLPEHHRPDHRHGVPSPRPRNRHALHLSGHSGCPGHWRGDQGHLGTRRPA